MLIKHLGKHDAERVFCLRNGRAVVIRDIGDFFEVRDLTDVEDLIEDGYEILSRDYVESNVNSLNCYISQRLTYGDSCEHMKSLLLLIRSETALEKLYSMFR